MRKMEKSIVLSSKANILDFEQVVPYLNVIISILMAALPRKWTAKNTISIDSYQMRHIFKSN